MTVQNNEERKNIPDKIDKLDGQLNEALERERKSIADRRKPRSGRSSAIFILLAIIIGLSALGISSYVFYQQYLFQDWQMAASQKLSSSDNRLNDLDLLLPRIGEMNKHIESLDRSMLELSEAGVRTQNQVDEKLKAALKAVDKKLGATSEDWILAEVEYLVRLANQRAMLDSDIMGARNLLLAADTILNESAVLTAFEVRQAITNDLVRLESLDRVDHAGVYARLTAIYNMVGQLKQKRLAYSKPESLAEESVVAEPSWPERISGLLARMWKDMVALVDFRRNDVVIKPLLPPEEEYYLKQNLGLKLELARIALLRGNQLIYDHSLTEAREWIEENFDSEDKLTVASLTRLEEVSTIAVKIELPDLSESLQAIRKYMMKFNNARTPVDTEAVQ